MLKTVKRCRILYNLVEVGKIVKSLSGLYYRPFQRIPEDFSGGGYRSTTSTWNVHFKE